MSKLSYLIDTGAEVSVLPPRSEDRNRSPINNMQLQAANGTAIRTFGQRSVAVELGLAKSFEWSFTIADVSNPSRRSRIFLRRGPAFVCHVDAIQWGGG